MWSKILKYKLLILFNLSSHDMELGHHKLLKFMLNKTLSDTCPIDRIICDKFGLIVGFNALMAQFFFP